MLTETILVLGMLRMAPVSLGIAKEYGPKVDAWILKMVKR